MKNSQKGFANIALIVVIIAIVAVGGYFVLKPKTNIAPQPSPTADTNNPSSNKPLPAGGSAGRGDEGGIRSADGKKIILIETSEGEGAEGQYIYYITIDGKDGKAYKLIGDALFSPDSKQYAYAAGNGTKQFIVLNGKELKYYDYVYTPAFSPNSSRFVYVASVGVASPNWKQFVVIDGVEGKQYQKVELAFADSVRGFSLNSKHLVYSASENNKWFVVIDGKEGNKYDRVSMLTISADGKKVTYEAQTGSSKETITENLD
ncbi:hypothetical protein A2643_01170 [Candidatus Nomurabacteria bacterium RIFCSPHIGHO2_01_FULL_39_220]|uniref:Dipeptidylpeptidase IV N-terminal domain-containing protein n=1 Tax=Candidatus Nomurabacteria bacterium RIFCSPLOWO2_02_FULL_40_67 TaxID=1801787 RepID=A0A1F6Y2I7_9BACT|nr:MAG: hypothetical protein UU01_C0005G0007 [Parcubacteria group bacterium GW2011_GWA2_40_37]OGI61571.1 MAG: hypothetical protein A2W12_02995 [Candidatus Nomurabacteria bacterium RBG_16_40_11]OGI71028.1 MAG: hypothetical protein A2643_01170 [Candidatus Nomurabacteria bacterium RIFCSPHIGHO2_01_FULL_39_220]OGI72475.1 MAG: hypothetical protein A2W56_01070 [Candidatus Nomurabacteria bacterium RIFCSPHIGHO2_02_41_18]OGI78576.1 MAG: hypothetical protein A3C65_02425 [Candidatus Nomurabacteria bacteriu